MLNLLVLVPRPPLRTKALFIGEKTPRETKSPLPNAKGTLTKPDCVHGHGCGQSTVRHQPLRAEVSHRGAVD